MDPKPRADIRTKWIRNRASPCTIIVVRCSLDDQTSASALVLEVTIEGWPCQCVHKSALDSSTAVSPAAPSNPWEYKQLVLCQHSSGLAQLGTDHGLA